MDEKPDVENKKFIKENVSKKRTPAEKMVLRILKVIGFGVLLGISALVTMVLLRPAMVSLLTPQPQSSVNSADTSADAAGITDAAETSDGSGASGTDVSEGDAASVDASAGASDGSDEISGSDTTSERTGSGEFSEGIGQGAGSSQSGTAASGAAPSGTSQGSSSTDTSHSSGSQDGSDTSDGSVDADDLSLMWEQISDIGNQVDRYIVDVCSIKNATDWFDNHFEKKDVYSGIIISADDSEICVLTVSAAVSSADSLRVSLNDGRLFPAALKKSDSLTGLAVISFDPEDEGMVSAEIIEETQSQGDSGSSEQSVSAGSSTRTAADSTEYEPIEAISLDTSGSAKRGDLVIAAGSPKGISHSIAYSWLSYVTEPISITDGTTRLFYADRDVDCSKGTWIIDLDGNLIGWLSDNIKEDDTDSQVIMSIADYRDVLETMVKGEDRAYLGVSVVDMDTIHSGPDYPEGVYVKSVAFGGPAYNSGLQPGDYIADIGGHRITSLRSFKYAMNHIQAGSTVTILIYRQSKESYKNIVFEIETGMRSSR